jgi:hypothetical protein
MPDVHWASLVQGAPTIPLGMLPPVPAELVDPVEPGPGPPGPEVEASPAPAPPMPPLICPPWAHEANTPAKTTPTRTAQPTRFMTIA